MLARIDWPKIAFSALVLGFVTYVFFQSRKASAAPSPSPAPAPDPPPDPPPSPTPSPTPGAPAVFRLVDLGNPVPVANGGHYRAVLKLSGFEKSFANRARVEEQFRTIGFSNVHAFGPDDSITADWPDDAVQGHDDGTWYVEGDWQKPSSTFPRPPQVALAWKQ